jgi:hypothetical protein
VLTASHHICDCASHCSRHNGFKLFGNFEGLLDTLKTNKQLRSEVCDCLSVSTTSRIQRIMCTDLFSHYMPQNVCTAATSTARSTVSFYRVHGLTLLVCVLQKYTMLPNTGRHFIVEKPQLACNCSTVPNTKCISCIPSNR